MKSDPQLKLAVLIDADNTQPTIIDGLLAEIAKYGVASVKRIYGDWTNPNLRGWKERLLEYAIQPVQQFAYTTGKNSTDSAMIIDAMDLLYTENLDGFCLVSSDSDFTRLAARLREDGKLVLGFGQRKTPKPFVAACDKFIYTEILQASVSETEEGRESSLEKESGKGSPPQADIKSDTKMKALLASAVDEAADEFGWAYLGEVGTYLANRLPEFDPRNYGFRKLGDLIKAVNLFEIDERTNPMVPGNQVYLRLKQRGKS